MSVARSLLPVAALVLVIAPGAPTRGQDRPQPKVEGAVDAAKANSIKDVFDKLFACWKPPPVSAASPMDITVRFSFNRSGDVLGRPRITYESAAATDRDRLAYRVAVMEALQRCTPMPFTDAMAGAIAGHPLSVQFRNHLDLQEKRAWLPPTIR